MLSISDSFDAGAIEVLEIAPTPTGAAQIRLNVRRDSTTDPSCDFRQWFYFRLQGARGRVCTITLANAGQCTYPKGWDGYRAVASYDRREWFRVPTRYEAGSLHIDHTPLHDSVFYAYFEPYSYDRHLDFIGSIGDREGVEVIRLGSSVDGRDLDLVVIGTPGQGKSNIWVIARQHPGESMAEWFVEGMIERLLDTADPLVRVLLQRSVFHVVPNMNPDGSVRGNLRANAAGANLNREWSEPSRERSPEVFFVRERMLATGVDAFLDVHGDEGLPYVFVAGNEMLPGYSDAQRAVQERFCAAFRAASPDFQTVHGYASGKYDAQALKLASKYIGHRFGCLSLTLEMPFKDNADLPDASVGWDGARSKRLGAAALGPLLEVIGR